MGEVKSLVTVVKKNNTSVVEPVNKSRTNRSREYFCKHSPAAGKVWYCSLQFVPRENNSWNQWRTQEFFFRGVQQIQLRTEDRENGDLGAAAL
jgi:hypothetical protein